MHIYSEPSFSVQPNQLQLLLFAADGYFDPYNPLSGNVTNSPSVYFISAVFAQSFARGVHVLHTVYVEQGFLG
jgi:hypothetical protein